MEEFYSIQGEGKNSGKAAYFLRIGGCDVGCHWCDVKVSWNAEMWPLSLTDEIVARIVSCPAKSLVITGGEPLQYDLTYLCHQLKDHGVQTFLETSGACKLTGEWDWVCLSPKTQSPPLAQIFSKADELKVIIHSPSDFQWAEENAAMAADKTLLILQPEWSRRNEMIPLIVEYILLHPKWNISLQSHKYMNIP